MVGKVIVNVVLMAILASLGSALVAILRGRSGLTLQALTLRVALRLFSIHAFQHDWEKIMRYLCLVYG